MGRLGFRVWVRYRSSTLFSVVFLGPFVEVAH